MYSFRRPSLWHSSSAGRCAKAVAMPLVAVALLLACFRPLMSASSETSSAPSRSASEIKPDLVLDFSSDLVGFVEPCGCVTGQYGGVARRATYLKRARASGIPILTLFAGDLVAGVGELNDIRADTLLAAFAQMKYDAAVPGEMDLLEGADVVRRRWLPHQFSVAGNLTDTDGKPILPRYLVRTVTIPPAGGRPGRFRVAITGLISPDLLQKAEQITGTTAEGLRLSDPKAALLSLLPRMKKEADLVVVLAHLGVPAAAQLGKDVPDVDVIIAGHNPTVSVLTPPDLGGPLLVAAGDRGRHITELRLKLSQAGIEAYSTRQQPLGDIIPNDPALAQLMETYRSKAAGYGREVLAALAARRTEQAGPYTGAKVCAMCHQAEDAQWKTTKHPNALEALKKWHPSAAYRVECLQCHVVGLGSPYGYLGEKATPQFVGVQCENCHGPGRKHVDAAFANKPSAALITKTPTEALCRSCHDLENDPHFDFPTYIVKVRHK